MTKLIQICSLSLFCSVLFGIEQAYAASVPMQPLSPAVVKPAILSGICDVEVFGGINFGKVYTAKATDTDINGSTIRIMCHQPVSGKVGISLGDNYSSKGRSMGAGDNRLYYNIYLDPQHNMVFGDGSRGTLTASFAPPFPVYIHVFARLYGRQQGGEPSYSADLPVFLTVVSPAPLPLSKSHPAMQPLSPAQHSN